MSEVAQVQNVVIALIKAERMIKSFQELNIQYTRHFEQQATHWCHTYSSKANNWAPRPTVRTQLEKKIQYRLSEQFHFCKKNHITWQMVLQESILMQNNFLCGIYIHQDYRQENQQQQPYLLMLLLKCKEAECHRYRKR